MKLMVDLHRSGLESMPLTVTIDDRLPVGELAGALHEACGHVNGSPARPDDLTLAVHGPDGLAPLPPSAAVADAGLHSGSTVSLLSSRAGTAGAQRSSPTVVLRVVDGPSPAREFHLPAGPTVIGRDRGCTVRLEDPTVSKRHARLEAGETLEIVDLNSANGVLIDGVLAPRAILKVGTSFTLGDSVLQVTRFEATERGRTAPTVQIIRSPRVEQVFPASEFPAPEPPQPIRPQRMPWIGLVTPLIFGAVLFFVTRNPASIVFVALSPVMMLGSFVESRWSAKRDFAQARAEFEASVAAFRSSMAERAEGERAARLREHPGALDAVAAIDARAPLIWSRRQDRPGFLEVRLACGQQLSRSKVTLPSANRTAPDLWQTTTALAEEFRVLDGVPVVGDFQASGAVGLAGPVEARNAAARGLLLQMVALHSPADLLVAAMAPPQRSPEWDWLTWLPHVAAASATLGCEPLVSTAGAISTLATSLESLIESRLEARQSSNDPAPLPAVLVLIDAEVPVERARLVELSERGTAAGVHAIWLAGQTAALPAVCRAFLALAGPGCASTGDVLLGQEVAPAVVEPIALREADRLARQMAAWVDAGVLGGTAAALPAAVSFLDIAGEQLVTGEGVRERWQEAATAMASGKRRPASLRAPIGSSAGEPYTLDLRAQGPHALVGGTTGAGKSELLQTWILGLATMHSPERVNFLLVDYKGGSAFAECVNLPHTVGLVTDLTPHLVARALTSLHAELRYREKVLHRAKAKDLQDLERKSPDSAMPSLVIVVDEFAALASEVPDFVDGMVNIAQRGRSLGLHLILATQRPAGVIRDNLRANTNLRVALRLADADDSNDVIGTDLASTFPQDIPGRAAARMGPGRLVPFQTAYVGGWTQRDTRPQILIEETRFGTRRMLSEQNEDAEEVAADLGPTDIQQVVAATRDAADAMGLPRPRQPWLPELAATYRLLDLPRRRTDAELVIAARDEPEEQAQTTAAFYPDTDGNMAIFGTGGSGKSAVLRTVAAAAGLTARGGVCHVYALDFGSRGLTMLEALPHVGAVIPGDDHERIARLLRLVRATIDERARRYAKANAGTITEYRSITGHTDEPRILLLLDNIAAFRQAYEVGPLSKWFDMLQSIAADGRQVGVHLVVSADRPGSIPTALASVIQRRLVLRLAADTDYAMIGVPADGFTAQTPPGRGFLDGYEVQVAVLGGDPNVAEQARRTKELSEILQRGGVRPAEPIKSLPERVALSTLPVAVGALPPLGIADETLASVGFPDAGTLLVTGPPSSGRTTAVAAMLAALRRLHPERATILLAGRRSALQSLGGWSESALGEQEVAESAGALAAALQDEHHKPCVIVLESAADFGSGGAETQLQDLVKACRDYGHLLIAEAEISGVGGSWGLLAALKAGRQGLVLQPDQLDGDSILRTPFPRVSRAEFPPGRGFLVHGGKAVRVQVAIPE
jgi:S-DNA-T family DNA segregation ATPase FtsK/SpoIIIE